jgi:thiamine-phosphate pyrophosphorylase
MTQLMIVLEVGDGALERLAAARGAGTVASIVLRAPSGQTLTAAQAAPLVEAGQRVGIAMLIDADAELARTLRADGVHIPVSEAALQALEAARAWVGGRAIVGVDAGRSRHDAMSLGEAGADYVAFGIPPFVKARDDAVERRLDLVAWWAEIFEVPVVAMDVADVAEARELASAGADFVCLTVPNGMTAADAAHLVTEAHAACREGCGKALQES